MPTKTTTPKSPKTAKTGAGTPPVRKLTKPELVHSEPAPAAEPGAEAPVAAAGKAGMRLKDLVNRVVTATGSKRQGVKEIVEATLAQMGDALQRGETLNLPAFGKARVARPGKDGGGAMTVKLRRGTGEGGKAKAAAAGDKDTLAEESDQG